MVRVLRLRHWTHVKSTSQQLLLQARVDDEAMDEVDQAEAEAGVMDAMEGVVWAKHRMTSVQITLLDSHI